MKCHCCGTDNDEKAKLCSYCIQPLHRSTVGAKGKSWPANTAIKVASEIVEMLKPVCTRIVVAGSLRREKPVVGDIEILFIPQTVDRPDGFFDTKSVNLADELIEQKLAEGYFAKRPGATGVFAWGKSNKLGIHTKSGIHTDLFATNEENWHVSLVIRTGSKETNLRLTTGANKLNRTLLAYGCGVKDRATGEAIRAKSEEDVFKLCGVPYLPPDKR